MTSLTRYEHQGFELYIDFDGAVFATQRGIARMCKVSHTAIQKWVVGNQILCNKIQMPTEQGNGGGNQKKNVIQTVSLYDLDAVSRALAHFNPERLRQWAIIGLQATAHQLVKWKDRSRVPLLSELRPGSFEEYFFDLIKPNEMEVYTRLASQLSEDEAWDDFFFVYQPDNSQGFATLDAMNRCSKVREFTLFASSKDFEGREIIHSMAADYFDINDNYLEDGVDYIHCMDKSGNRQTKIPSLQLTIEPAPRRSKLGNQLSSFTPPVPPSI